MIVMNRFNIMISALTSPQTDELFAFITFSAPWFVCDSFLQIDTFFASKFVSLRVKLEVKTPVENLSI